MLLGEYEDLNGDGDTNNSGEKRVSWWKANPNGTYMCVWFGG